MRKLLLLLSIILFVLLTDVYAQFERVGISHSTHQFNTRDFSAGGIQMNNYSRFNALHFSLVTKINDEVSFESRISIGSRNLAIEFEDSPGNNIGYINDSRSASGEQTNRFFGLSLDIKYRLFELFKEFQLSPIIGFDLMYENHENPDLIYFLRPYNDPLNQSAIFQYSEVVNYGINPFMRVGLEVEKALFEKLYLTLQLDYSLPLLGTYSIQNVEFVSVNGSLFEGNQNLEPITYQQEYIRNRLFTLNTRIGLSYKFR